MMHDSRVYLSDIQLESCQCREWNTIASALLMENALPLFANILTVPIATLLMRERWHSYSRRYSHGNQRSIKPSCGDFGHDLQFVTNVVGLEIAF